MMSGARNAHNTTATHGNNIIQPRSIIDIINIVSGGQVVANYSICPIRDADGSATTNHVNSIASIRHCQRNTRRRGRRH